MKFTNILLLLLLSVFPVLLSSCAFQKPLPAMSYDTPPENYERLIVRYFHNVLKDPESAKYEFDVPRRAYANAGLAYGGQVTWTGYAVRVQVNAKNSYGGYVGFTPYTVLFTGVLIHDIREGQNPVLVTFVD